MLFGGNSCVCSLAAACSLQIGQAIAKSLSLTMGRRVELSEAGAFSSSRTAR